MSQFDRCVTNALDGLNNKATIKAAAKEVCIPSCWGLISNRKNLGQCMGVESQGGTGSMLSPMQFSSIPRSCLYTVHRSTSGSGRIPFNRSGYDILQKSKHG